MLIDILWATTQSFLTVYAFIALVACTVSWDWKWADPGEWNTDARVIYLLTSLTLSLIACTIGVLPQ